MASKLRNSFTEYEILGAYHRNNCNITHAAAELTKLGLGTVKRRVLSNWIANLQREFYEELGINENKSILVIPDIHAPYHHPDTLAFLGAVKRKYKPTTVVNLGDEADNHALSMHDSDPSLDSAGMELKKTRVFMKQLAQMFPKMKLAHSNHGSLAYRRAFKAGIPIEYIKSYKDILFPDGGGEGWEWADEFTLTLPNGELVTFAHHYTGNPIDRAARSRGSLVLGHMHGKFDISYSASGEAIWFAMRSGCLIDHKSMAFAYGKLFKEKPIVGCSVIIDSVPRLIPMELGEGGRWTGKVL